MRWLAIVLALALVCPAAAQEAQVIGIGAMDCRQTIDLIGGREFKLQLASWINGYFTAREASTPGRDLQRVNLDTSAGDVHAYCARHPDDYIVDAATHMYEALPRK